MFSTASSFELSRLANISTPAWPSRKFMAAATVAAACALSFTLVAFAPTTSVPMQAKTTPTEAPAAPMPCETIDWRVGEKLNVLAGWNEPRARAVVTRMTEQRDIARANCRAGQVDNAMDMYRLMDRALTRYVQYGMAPALPK